MANDDERADPQELRIEKGHLGFPVVGIGASAGGVTALRQLFSGMPADSGMAFVVVMHLSPDHESSLGPILQGVCKLPVMTVERSTPIEPNRVYVISPANKLAMSDGHLRVSAMQTVEGRRGTIDLFFRSLAQAHWERAVCVVLSGIGSDGSQGLKRIKELGGVSIAQSAEDAEFDGMPRSAVSTGLVDFVLPVAEIPGKLVELWENAKRIELPTPPRDLEVRPVAADEQHLAEEALVSIKALLRERTGHDFSRYKRATVLRRLERRMQVHALPDLPSYSRLLQAEPKETQALLQDMLISVTNFFRDPDSFAALAATLGKYLAGRDTDQPFRAWIAGCATGEEAYSVTILLRELLGPAAAIQVFASDIDKRAVAAARTGAYPPSIATDVSAARLAEFFTDGMHEFRINKAIRDCVVFSAHNVLSDPPFIKMDLICCRNVLIYLDRAAQAQLLQSFNFALNPGGLLFLGSSETADLVDGLFVVQDKRHRIYQVNTTTRLAVELPPVPNLQHLHPLASMPERAVASLNRPPLEMLHERVRANHAPPSVLVDADDTALQVDERAAHLLRLPAGAPSNKLTALARPELRADLRAVLSRAARTGRSVESRRIQLVVNGQERFVRITARPALDESPGGLFLVTFDESEETMAPCEEQVPDRDPVIEALEADLRRTQDELRSTRGESAASTEELRASNEELQTINEELRSTTEELETSREELQAVNEELSTVNAELGLKIEETGKANDDLQNLMVSAEIGAVFVDSEMRIKRFTPQAATLFNLRPADVGRPLFDITHRLDYPQLAADASQVLRDLRRVEREVRSSDGRWFLTRVLPYRTSEDRISGAIFTLFDVSSRRAAEERLRLSEQRMRLVADSMRDYAIITMDEAGTISSWSPGAERVFGYTAEEAAGKLIDFIFTPEDLLSGMPRDEMRRAQEQGRAEDDRWHVRQDGQRIFCSGITTPLIDGGLVGYAKIARDFTSTELRDRRQQAALIEERTARETLRKAGAMKDEFLAVMSHELKNPLAVIQVSAQLLERLPGFSAEPRAARAAGAIKTAVASQAQIINDLLELSRVSTGKVVLAPSMVDLPGLIRNIVDAVGPELAAKGQTLEAELAEPLIAMVDPVRIEQIVWNLLTNAIKFTPLRGDIRLSLTIDGDMAKLTVADSGVGIEPALLGDIFEMFRQVDTGTSRSKTGLGIGLALVKQLAELHGGKADATSEGPGLGSQFHVWLPLSGAGASAGTTPQADQRQLEGLRILLVDDELLLLSAFTDLLKLEGASVVAVNTAVRALDTARGETFDVVVSDIAMPERDGYWLARQLRAAEETRRVPMVAVSGMAREADRLKALEAGFDAHIGKPLELDALRITIGDAMARYRDA